MTGNLKVRGIILTSGIFLYCMAVLASFKLILPDRVKFIFYLIAYLVIGFEAFRKISGNILGRKLLDENILMVLGTVGAFGVGRYMEAVAAMLLFQIGDIFEAVSVDRTKRTIAQLIDIRPEYATRKVRGKEVKVDPSELKLRHIIIIKPGERVPVDGVVTSGISNLDTKALTGEAMPQAVKPGDTIYSGSINLTGAIEARVTKLYKDSTVSRIMEMVEDAQNHKAESESFITKFAKVYTPAVTLAAFLIMFLPPLTFAHGDYNTWVYRGLVVMIAACPAGLVMSIPVAFLGGIASAARQGIIIKGGNYLEDLAKADTFVFDKTGTLTEGVFKVKEIKPAGMTEEELLAMTAHIESYSNHPIAQSLMTAYEGKYDKTKVKRVKEEPGYGISATYDGERVHIGNLRMAEKYHVEADRVKSSGTVIYVIKGNKYAGYIVISDTIKEDAKSTLEILKEKYNAVLVMLTGDSKSSGTMVAKELHMDYAYTNLMPQDKLEQMEEFILVQDDSEKVVCVGDGINDAPVIARADVGIAMGALGSAAAIEAADIVLMEDELPRIIDALRIARETIRVVSQNISFALVIKFIILLLAAIGYISMWEAVFADVGVMIISIINAAWVVKYSA